MELFESFESLAARLEGQPGTALTIGVFDGLHLGHQALIERTRTAARQAGLSSLVITFQEHPLCVLAPPYCPKRLLARERKHALLKTLGVDLVADVPFTEEFARTPPEEFITRILAGACHARHIVCGYDFSFGRAGAGNTTLLREQGGRLGISVEVVEAVSNHSVHVKSTMIRDQLLSGDVAHASRLLTRPYELTGPVVPGFARGRTLGFPTANLDVPPSRIIPARGVYLCAARVLPGAKPLHGAMVNIGFSPTFGPGRLSVEAHLLHFDGELTGRTLQLHFLARLRDEQKFDGPAALAEQLHRDREHSIRLLESAEIRKLLESIPEV